MLLSCKSSHITTVQICTHVLYLHKCHYHHMDHSLFWNKNQDTIHLFTNYFILYTWFVSSLAPCHVYLGEVPSGHFLYLYQWNKISKEKRLSKDSTSCNFLVEIKTFLKHYLFSCQSFDKSPPTVLGWASGFTTAPLNPLVEKLFLYI